MLESFNLISTSFGRKSNSSWTLETFAIWSFQTFDNDSVDVIYSETSKVTNFSHRHSPNTAWSDHHQSRQSHLPWRPGPRRNIIGIIDWNTSWNFQASNVHLEGRFFCLPLPSASRNDTSIYIYIIYIYIIYIYPDIYIYLIYHWYHHENSASSSARFGAFLRPRPPLPRPLPRPLGAPAWEFTKKMGGQYFQDGLQMSTVCKWCFSHHFRIFEVSDCSINWGSARN